MNWSAIFFLNSSLLGLGLAVDAFSVSIADGLSDPTMKKGKAALIATMFAFFQALMPMIGWLCIHTIASKFAAFSYAIPWIALFLLGFIGGKMIFECVKKRKDEALYLAKNAVIKNKTNQDNIGEKNIIDESGINKDVNKQIFNNKKYLINDKRIKKDKIQNTDGFLLTQSDGKIINEIKDSSKIMPHKKLSFLTLFTQSVATSIDALSVGFTIVDYGLQNALVCSVIIAFITFILCIFGVFLGKKFGNKFSKWAELIGGIVLIAIGIEIFISNMISLY